MTRPRTTAPAQDATPTAAPPVAAEAAAPDAPAPDAPAVPALLVEHEAALPDDLTGDDLIPDQPALVLYLRDLRAEDAPEEPPIWPVPWREEDAAPWWRRAWAHAQGAWISTALATLLVLGVLGAGLALHLTPPSLNSATTAHPTATAHPLPPSAARTTPLATSPASTTHPIWQSATTQSGSGGHGGHGHKRK